MDLTPEGRDKIIEIENQGFERDYSIKLKKNPTLKPERYIDIMSEVGGKLTSKYSISTDNTDYSDILESESYPKLKEFMMSRGKGRRIAEHDSFHVLLIQKLRI